MTPQPDSTPLAQPQPDRKAMIALPWRRGAIAVGLVVGGFVLGAGSLAAASGEMPGHGGKRPGIRIGMIQHVVRAELENVGATTAQEDKIHDIIAVTYTDIDRGRTDREALRKQVLDLLRAPTIDRAAAEKLRADQVAAFDAKSRKIVAAVLDAAGQLTPEQRTKLAQQIDDKMAHGGWRAWQHRDPSGDKGGDRDKGSDDHGDRGNPGDHG